MKDEALSSSILEPSSVGRKRLPDSLTGVPRVRGGVRRRWRVNAIVTSPLKDQG
jgi:hypothetical protein